MNVFGISEHQFLYMLYFSGAGDDILINDNPEIKKGMINNVCFSANLRFDTVKSMITNTEVKRGDLITVKLYGKTEKWLVLSDNLRSRDYYKVIMQKCNHNIKFNFEGTVKEFSCVADSKVFDIETNQFLSVPSGKIVVTMQDNPDSDNITIGQRFIKMKNAWKVTGIDRTKNGLLILWCDLDTIISSDDVVNEIASAGDYVFTVEITNGETASIQAGNTLQLATVVKLNGNPVDNKTVVYSCDNTSIATVDANGLITAIQAGECIITAYLIDNPNVYDTITIVVSALPQHNYSVTISGNTSIVKSKTATYTATFTDNAVPITETSEFWLTSDDGISTTTLATITSQDPVNNTCVVTAGNTIGYVKLWVKNTAGTIVSQPYRIQIRNIF